MMVCERCKREMYRPEICNYCGKKICNSCMKASQKASKLVRLVICKDDWSSIPMRKLYKNKRNLIEEKQQKEQPQQRRPA